MENNNNNNFMQSFGIVEQMTEMEREHGTGGVQMTQVLRW